MRKLLVGINDKNCSMRAVTYLVREHPDARECEATLVHVIPDLPAMYWDDGHILSEAEERETGNLMESLVQAGAVRFRPIALTAAAVVVASLVMLFDPIFQGLAISMMFGAVGATVLTLIAVPLLYMELVPTATVPEREDGEDRDMPAVAESEPRA